MADEAIALIEKHCLAITPALAAEDVLGAYDRLLFYQRELKRVKELVEAALLEWIQMHGALEAGNGVRYYAGVEKVTKCVDVQGTVDALLQVCGGDLRAFTEVLASNAIKPGAARHLLPPEQFSALFKTEERGELREGKTVKKVMRADERFTR